MSCLPSVNRFSSRSWVYRFPLLAGLAFTGCIAPSPGTELKRTGDEIVVCGRMFHTGTSVVLWTDPFGYDAYRAEKRFGDTTSKNAKSDDGPTGQRYGTIRKHIPDELKATVRDRGWKLEELQDQVDLFVLHYDVCGTARRCFKVLHDLRGLSVHFMLDVDGTIYQTLDLKERAYHAGKYNDRSVGIEIANMGAYADRAELNKWYESQPNGAVIFNPPLTNGATGILTPDFLAQPSRRGLIVGKANGTQLHQYDYTEKQYRALERLTATLSRVLPRIKLEVPRDADGNVRTDAMTADELAEFSGLIGHHHLTKHKIDPGPAFDWDRVIGNARRLR